MEGQEISLLAMDVYICSCALCGHGFPAKDVVMESCGCNYHPWCIVTQTWLSKNCANQDCDKVFTEEWRASLGVFNRDDCYFQGLASLRRSPEESPKGYLNSDIGGNTPRIKQYRDKESDGSGPSHGSKKIKVSMLITFNRHLQIARSAPNHPSHCFFFRMQTFSKKKSRCSFHFSCTFRSFLIQAFGAEWL